MEWVAAPDDVDRTRSDRTEKKPLLQARAAARNATATELDGSKSEQKLECGS